MANKRSTVFAKGKLYWAKIVGDRALSPNYDGDGRQWAFEFAPEDPSFLKEYGLLDRLKSKEDAKNPDKGEFIYLKKPEFDREGVKNEPFRIYNEDNEPWGDDVLIGNGTSADVKLSIVDYGKGKKSGIYTTAIRVTDLVPYSGNEFSGMDGDSDTPKASGRAAAKPKPSTKAPVLDELDDEIPF